ncbi:uncharacterized protein CFAP97D2 [Spea bombifrons]|uniref:uncharacterized protein CFAP97D2 n=1 Tax=Spea bombifrons TaxID=233779 RepID=UPI00234B8C93|nr:uncharacterized protein CFAP97D2 [Spea bombifrons]
MHRSYQPILPCGNKYLQQKWDQTYYDEHRRKVQSAKPMVDTNSPQTYVHLNMKLKKLKLEEERLSVIERDNRLLLEKMSHIMRTKGRVDNTNDYEAKSLNKEKREQELLRVSRENQAILERINKCEPQYQVERWHEDWVKAERYMDSIARYPRGWYITHQHKHSSKGQKSSMECSSATAKEGTVQSGRRKESLRGSHNNKRGVTRKETVSKKDGKTIILKQTQSVGKHEKENKKIKGDDKPGRDKDAVSDTEVDEQSTDEAAAEAAVNEEPTDNTTVNGNLADVAAENEYLKDEHEDYTEDDNEKEGTSESEKEEESDSEKEGGSESDEEAEGEKKDDSDN